MKLGKNVDFSIESQLKKIRYEIRYSINSEKELFSLLMGDSINAVLYSSTKKTINTLYRLL